MSKHPAFPVERADAQRTCIRFKAPRSTALSRPDQWPVSGAGNESYDRGARGRHPGERVHQTLHVSV